MQIGSLVSVIIPAFNPNRYLLKKAIDSVLSQTYSNIEIVIGDDGSTVPIETYIHELIFELNNYQNIEIRIVRSEVNKGISNARNHAIKHSKGIWLVWLDADDSLQNDCIEQLIKESASFNLVIGECDVYDKDSISRRKPKPYFEYAKKYLGTEKDPFLLNIISLQPQLISKSVFNEIGGFNEEYRYAELTELFLRYISKKGLMKMKFIEGAIYNYNRKRENTLSANRLQLFEYRLKALSSYKSKNKLDSTELKYIERDSLTGFQKYKLSKTNSDEKSS